MDRDAPFPQDAVCDALGFVRLLYAARLKDGRVSPPRTDPLVAIGLELRAALKLGRCEPGNLGCRAANERAERALSKLAGEVTLADSPTAMARAAVERMTGRSNGAKPRRVER